MIAKIQSLPYFTYLVRIVPFAAFAALTLLQGQFGETGAYWVYALKTIIGALLIWLVLPYVKEMRWNFSWEAVAAGVAVFLLWVGIDGLYPNLGFLFGERSASFNPLNSYGDGSIVAWIFVAVRILGSSLVVPPLEEVFYRSFLYRFFVKSDFLGVPFKSFDLAAFLIVGAAFGLSHYEWLPGIMCAFIYQGLVIRKGRLGDAITAHAITNFLLGLWVVLRSDYVFW